MSSRPYTRIRSVLETPVLDERKWAKLPSIPCDAVLVDMEDAVPLGRKPEGRARVFEVLQDRSFFGPRVVITRPNHLSSPWGRDDIVGLAQAGVDCLLYPKVRSAGEVAEVRRLLNSEGADPDLILCIETPQAVAHVEELAALPKVVGLSFGEGDLSAELGIPLYLPDGTRNPAMLQPRMRTIIAAAAANVAAQDFAVLRNIRDLDECRGRVLELASLGATTVCTIYPPHVDVVNEIFTPAPDQVAHAREVVRLVDEARAAGNPAVQLDSGETLLIHDYAKAQLTLARASRLG
jgi:citrate lyase beta subunit